MLMDIKLHALFISLLTHDIQTHTNAINYEELYYYVAESPSTVMDFVNIQFSIKTDYLCFALTFMSISWNYRKYYLMSRLSI